VDRTPLIGKWVTDNGDVIANDDCTRIEYLIENEFTKVSSSAGGWKTLFMDKKRLYWERTYNESHLHGGGPASLIPLSKDEAISKYFS